MEVKCRGMEGSGYGRSDEVRRSQDREGVERREGRSWGGHKDKWGIEIGRNTER